ncbi:hypothetical protein SKAU_G00356940 [Synaphobranchus kaupii]|uniref:Uncharacterized protein n=1 Tax=Synaphobranchus kaupii TaxID=118154 RepID=A0A9Q1IEK4_SYNKA|nr:hypothetical protein SKAU_G00356940 [Synaphobranchus kaupii]
MNAPRLPLEMSRNRSRRRQPLALFPTRVIRGSRPGAGSPRKSVGFITATSMGFRPESRPYDAIVMGLNCAMGVPSWVQACGAGAGPCHLLTRDEPLTRRGIAKTTDHRHSPSSAAKAPSASKSFATAVAAWKTRSGTCPSPLWRRGPRDSRVT